jgi:hypothetical protein
MPKGARLSGDAGCVALRPNGGDPIAPRSFDGEGARANIVSARAGDRTRLPGEDRLVEPENLARLERPVRDNLVTGGKPHQIADDELLDASASLDAVANNCGRRRDERGEPVESTLRPNLLNDPDRRVRDQDAEEERITPVAEDEGDDAEDEQDQVEDREDIGADDACVGAARRGGREWFALREQAGGFDLREAARHRVRLPVERSRRSRDVCQGHGVLRTTNIRRRAVELLCPSDLRRVWAFNRCSFRFFTLACAHVRDISSLTEHRCGFSANPRR